MTKAEWRKIKPGMSRAKIKQISGINDKVDYTYTYGNGWQIDKDIDYEQCRRNGKPACSTATAYFENYEYGDSWTNGEDYWVPLHLANKGGWGTPYTW